MRIVVSAYSTTKGSLKLTRHRRDAYDTLDSASFVPQEGISV